MYTMTGLYSDNIDDNSSIDVPGDSENSENGSQIGSRHVVDGTVVPNYVADTVIKCHSRQPSAGIIDQRDKTAECNDDDDDAEMSVDCGILTCRPKSFQKFARIKVCELIDVSSTICINYSTICLFIVFLSKFFCFFSLLRLFLYIADIRIATVDAGNTATST